MTKNKIKRVFLTALSALCALCALLGVACAQETESSSSAPATVTIALSETTADIDLYGQKELTATVSEGSSASEKTVEWSVSDPTVIELIEDGNTALLKGLKAGAATVTAKLGEAEQTCACTVTDRTGQVPKLSLNTAKVSINAAQTFTLVPAVYYDGIAVTETIAYSFRSENEAVATVSDSGVITGIALGKTSVYVTATYKDVPLSVKVDVEVKTSVVLELDKTELEFYRAAPGYDEFSEMVTVTIVPEKGGVADYSKLVWESSDEEVATVVKGEDGEATVTNGKAGKATVSVSYEVKTGVVLKEEIDVTVTQSSAQYAKHPTLGDTGILMTLSDGEWFDYPKAIDFNGKTSEESFIDFNVIPTTVGTSDFNMLYLRLTDTEDAGNYVELKFYRYKNADDYDFTIVSAATSLAPDTYVGYTNEKSPTAGCWTGANFLGRPGSSNAQYIQNYYYKLSFDYATKALYANYISSNMVILSDLDDTDTFYAGLEGWDGFTKGTAYLSIRTVGHIRSDLKSQIFIKGISDFDLSDPTKSASTPKVETSTHPVDNTAGQIVTLNAGDVYTYADAIDLKDKTSTDVVVKFSVLPTTKEVRDISQLYVKFTDTNNPSNYVLVKIHDMDTSYPWVYSLAKSAGQTWTGKDNTTVHASGNWGLTTTSNFIGTGISDYFSISFDYAGRAVYANRDGNQRILADLDDMTEFYPDGPLWSGFSADKCYVSIWVNWYNTSVSDSVKIFIPADTSTPETPVIPETPPLEEGATYVTDQSITVPTDWTDSALNENYFLLNGTQYAQGASVPLGNGLLVTENVQIGGNNLRFTRWDYANAIDLNGKTQNDIILDLSLLPTTLGTKDISYMDITFTDTEDSTNTVRVRLEKANNASWGFSVAKATFSAYPTADYFRGWTNNTNYAGGMWLGGDMRGNKNIVLSFDYANKAIYSYNQQQTGMQMIIDLDNTDHFPDGQWGGFTNGTAYVSVTMYGVATTTDQTQMLVRTIGDYDLQTGESNVTAQYKNSCELDITEESAYRVSGTESTDSAQLSEELKGTVTGDTAAWTYSTAHAFTSSQYHVVAKALSKNVKIPDRE